MAYLGPSMPRHAGIAGCDVTHLETYAEGHGRRLGGEHWHCAAFAGQGHGGCESDFSSHVSGCVNRIRGARIVQVSGQFILHFGSSFSPFLRLGSLGLVGRSVCDAFPDERLLFRPASGWNVRGPGGHWGL